MLIHRIALLPLLLLLLLPTGPASAQEDSGETPANCCCVTASGMPIASVAGAVGNAGDWPLWAVPGDTSTLEFELEGVCLPDLANTMIKSRMVRALKCDEREAFGLFSLELPQDQTTCEALAAPTEELPPGDLAGWTVTAVIANEKGERLALLSGPEGRSKLLGPGVRLASQGAKIEAIGTRGVLITRAGIDTLDGSAEAMSVAHLGGAAHEITCAVVEEIPAQGAAGEAAAEEGDTAAPPTDFMSFITGNSETPPADEEAATPAEEEATPAEVAATTIPVYGCEGLTVDFIQRPLPIGVVDDPAYQGKEMTAEVEFGEDGWMRRLVNLEADEAIHDRLSTAIRDWRIVPVRAADGKYARVRTTVTFVLEVPCR